jgi:penicillin G amidase
MRRCPHVALRVPGARCQASGRRLALHLLPRTSVNWTRTLLRLALGRRLPITTGTLKVPGLIASIVIRRDRWGIPVIEGGTDGDAWFGLGFCHAQDRAAQLDFFRRATRGTLSAMTGKAGLEIDRLARRVGLHRAARDQWPVLAADVRATIEAYVHGINAGFTFGLRRKPHEFAILGGQPEAWEPVDVVAYIKLQSLLITSNWDTELARFKLLLADGPEAVQALDPAPANNGPAVDPRGGDRMTWKAADRLAADLSTLRQALPARSGSNAWVIAGSKTKSGRPLLANDPHVGPTLPAPWYLAHLRGPGWAVCGATTAGAPGFAAGHNGVAAWGSTAGLIDNTDLFLEEIGPDGVSVRQGDKWTACEVVEETIEVRGGADVVERVLITPRGPIVSPALGEERFALSMRAVWLDPLPTRGLIDVHRTTTFDEFRNKFREWPVTPQHFVFADTAGSIGWQLTGESPIRNNGYGVTPQPGWSDSASWAGLVPFDQMPNAENPTAGYFVTANNPPVSSDAGPFLGDDWVNGYRAGVLTDAIASRNDWDVAGCQALQLDRRCKPWEEIRGTVLAAPVYDDFGRRGHELLAGWHGRVESDSAAASVYEFLFCELAERVAKAKAPNGYEWALGRGFGGLMPHTLFADRRFAHLSQLLREQPTGWFPRSWADEIADALSTAVRRLEAISKRSAADSRWSEVRPTVFKHLAFGDVKLLGNAFNVGPMEGGGDSNTPFQATVQPLDPLAAPAYTPTLRVVIDVGEWSNSRFVIAGGQSANPLSPHYADLLALWQEGRGVPIPWTRNEIDAATLHILNLSPV